MVDIKSKKCNDCCIFLIVPNTAHKRKYNDEEKWICWSGAKNQVSNCTDEEIRKKMKFYYDFKLDLVQRAEHAIVFEINKSEIGKLYRGNCIVCTFDEDPNVKLFGKQKNLEHKKPDIFYFFANFALVIEYDETIDHEKSIERLNLIKEENNVSKLFVIRINGHQEDFNSEQCMVCQKKTENGECFDINQKGFEVLQEVYELMEHIYYFNGNEKEKTSK